MNPYNPSLEELTMFRKHAALMAVSLILLALAPSGLTQNAGEDGKKNETSAEKSGLPLE